MDNTLLVYCRANYKYTEGLVAAKLGISLTLYQDIEKGKIRLSYKQAVVLGEFFNMDYSYFLIESLQMNLLLSNLELIEMLKGKIASLQEKLGKS